MKKITSVMLIVLIVALSAVVLFACKPELEVGNIDVSTVSYDGSKLTFGRVDNASYYLVTVNGGPQLKVEQSDNPTYEVALTENVEFALTAVATDGESTVMSDTVKKSFTYGGKVELSVDKDNGVVVFEPLEGVSEYVYSRNGEWATDRPVDNKIDVLVGENRIIVRPVSDKADVYYSDSDEVVATRLAPVANLVYSNGSVTWDAASGATEYRLQIQYGDQIVNTKTYDNAYLIDATISNRDFSISVTAVSSSDNVIDSVEKIANVKKMNPISDLGYSQGQLSFTAMPGASSYEVVISYNDGGTEVEKSASVETNKFDLFDYFEYINGITTYSVKVRPIFTTSSAEGEFAVGTWSAELDIKAYPKLKLSISDELVLMFGEGGQQGLDGYYVVNIKIISENSFDDITLGGEGDSVMDSGSTFRTYKLGDNNNSFSVSNLMSTGAQYSITAYYVYDGETGRTPVSDEILFFNIPSPKTYSIATTDDGKMSIDFNDVILPGDLGNNLTMQYDFYVNSTIVASSTESKFENLILDDILGNNSASDNDFYVLCGIYNGEDRISSVVYENMVFVSSVEAKAYKESFKILGQVQNVEFNLETTVTWSAENFASKYIVEITKDGYTHKDVTATPSYNLALIDNLPSGVYTLSVKAKGNGGNVVTSLAGSKLQFKKLAAVDSITCENGTLRWDEVEDASGYTVYIGNIIKSVGENNLVLNSTDIESTTGVQVNVVANSNINENILRSDVSKAVLTIRRLESPIMYLYNDKLTWERYSMDGVKIEYQLHDTNKTDPVIWNEGDTVMVSYPTSNLLGSNTGDERYNLTVVAAAYNGEGVSNSVTATAGGEAAVYYMDSKASNMISIQKLRTPILKAETDPFKAFVWDEKQEDTVNKQVMKVTVTYDDGYTDENIIIGNNSYAPYIDSTKSSFTITFQFIGDGQTSVDSDVYEYGTFDIVQFSAPVINNVSVEEDKKLKISAQSSDAQPVVNYIYTIAGVDHVFAENTYEYEMNSVGIYELQVRIEGGVFSTADGSNTYYYESERTTHGTTYEKCRTVQETEIYKDFNNVLHFTGRLEGYTLSISYVLKNVNENGEVSEVGSSTENIVLSDVTESTTLDFNTLNTEGANAIDITITVLSQGNAERTYVKGDIATFTFSL